ncbi:vasodilator-stimulated phosphoprotein-like [Zalophus californianus]|uniref:Vasodilator-stimulated phosphoprotein-like n=1 Tax=Zalophus californianus TaxID=9704 RepID=A0A6J2CBE8_ZALCA|nr:vasodilator-stimulated phosphoprotein-like [Zalophus californianus]
MAQAGHLRQVRARHPGTGASPRCRGGQRPRCPAPTRPGRPPPPPARRPRDARRAASLAGGTPTPAWRPRPLFPFVAHPPEPLGTLRRPPDPAGGLRGFPTIQSGRIHAGTAASA